MDLAHIIVLALVQGLTEFLPISSSAHLILVSVFTGWQDQGLGFDIAVHFGTLGAVVAYFRRDLRDMARDFLAWARGGEQTTHSRLVWAILWATLPVALAGLAFHDIISSHMRSPWVLAFGLIFFGALLGWADWHHGGNRDERGLGWKDILIIGCAQALALIPGTSRSGATMTAGLLLGLSREAAARFSFLLSIPVIFLAGAWQVRHLVVQPEPVQWEAMGLGVILAGVSAYLCIHFFLTFIRRVGMQPFVIYRVLLGLLLIGFF